MVRLLVIFRIGGRGGRIGGGRVGGMKVPVLTRAFPCAARLGFRCACPIFRLATSFPVSKKLLSNPQQKELLSNVGLRRRTSGVRILADGQVLVIL